MVNIQRPMSPAYQELRIRFLLEIHVFVHQSKLMFHIGLINSYCTQNFLRLIIAIPSVICTTTTSYRNAKGVWIFKALSTNSFVNYTGIEIR